ncbi:ATP-binding protein [Lacinutrix salivirga]
MLEAYKKNYAKAIIQYILIDFDGTIKESDDTLFSNIEKKNVSDLHPFFESFIDLLQTPNSDYLFSCIHLNINGKEIISDISLKTFSNNKLPLVIIQDLTAHYNNYQTSAQVRNESIINSQVLELKNSYLREKEEFKNAFIANFSHELRDPITGIITFTDILEKSNLEPQQKGYLDIINSSSNHLKKMIDDILDISKIEVGKLELKLNPFNLKELLEELTSSYKVKAAQKGLEFITNFNANLPDIVEGDAMRLRQMLSNLLDNAIKFTSIGNVTFNASLNQIRANKASIHFEVIDTGIGIAKEHIDTIFNSFKQLEVNTNTGSGLGLAIVKYLVELTNSKVNVESELNKGSTFSTNINFKLVDASKINKPKEAEELQFEKDRKYNILLVEDSEITQLSILKILASQGNFYLDIAVKSEDVLQRIENQEFDLVLMDIKLNNEKGDKIAAQIRIMPEREHRKIPILALTARVMKEDLKRYKKAGINGVIQKPFDKNTLLQKIYDALH